MITFSTLKAICQQPANLASGDTLYAVLGETVTLQGTVTAGTGAVVTAYDLTLDGTRILTNTAVDNSSTQWVQGSWTAPTTAGQHTLVLSGTGQGDAAPTTATYPVLVVPVASVVLDAAPPDVNPGTTMTVAGTLKRSTDYAVVPGAAVELWWLGQPDASGMAAAWTKLANATTDAQGRFQVPFTATASGKYQIRSNGKPGMVGPVWSAAVPLGVSAHLLLGVDTRSTTTGSPLTFTLNAPPTMAGTTGMLQVWNGLFWATVTSGPLDSSGSVTLTYRPPLSGSYKFGAMTGYSATHPPTASDDLVVNVR